MGNRGNGSRVVEPYKTTLKCPKHNQWKRKGVCELCRLELDAIQKQNELTGGSHKPKIIIKKL